MVEVQGSQGPHHPTPDEIKEYQKSYQESFTLFQKSFSDYQEPKLESHKKAKLEDVMQKALHIMNEVAVVVLSQEKQVRETTLKEDFASYLQHPNAESLQKVQDDISSLQSPK